MSCKTCKERLYPESPEAPWRHGGSWLPSLCDFCDYRGSPEWEREQRGLEESHLICEIKNCPVWKVVAELQQKVSNLGCEVTHIHVEHHKRKAEQQGDGW